MLTRLSTPPKHAAYPLYDAMRKFGSDAFSVNTVQSGLTKSEGQRLEKKLIAATPPTMLYNRAPGGDEDSAFAIKTFWDSMYADPVAFAAYKEKLSAANKTRKWSDYAAMTASAAAWRKANPKEAYALARRGCRIATKAILRKSVKAEDAPLTLKEKLLRKHKPNAVKKEYVTAVWARRSDEERKIIGAKIAASLRARHAKLSIDERSVKTAAARASIDRAKQGAAASKGLKAYWEKLREDPVAYAKICASHTGRKK